MRVNLGLMITTVVSMLPLNSYADQARYPYISPQDAVELATMDPSWNIRELYYFNVAVLNLVYQPDVESHVAKMYNYYHGEVQFTSPLVRCKGKAIVPYLQILLKQEAPVCPWGSKKHPGRKYVCVKKGQDWIYIKGMIRSDIESIEKTEEKYRKELCSSFSKYYHESVEN